MLPSLTSTSFTLLPALNLLENGSFEKGHFGFNASIGGIYHIIRSKPASHGRYVGRIQILTKSYQSKTPTTVFISQRMDYAKINPTNNFATASKLNSSIKAYRRMISFSAYSKSEQLFGWTTWRIELHIWYIKNSTSTTTSPAAPLEQQLQLLQTQPDVVMKQEYDMSSDGWQVRVLSHCLSADAQIAAVEVRGYLESYRGSVYWDDWSLIETY